MYVTLMNAFDKKIVLAFNNSFLKIELSCDREKITLILNTCSFQKKMLSNWTFVTHWQIVLLKMV